MTASAGAWYRVGTVNVTNDNQSVVGVDTNWQNDVIAIAVGDFFTLDAKTWYEVIAVNSDTSITLDRGFEGSTGTNKTYAIVRNTSGTILTRIAGQVSVQFNQKQLFLDELRTWLNSSNATEELTDSHGLKQSLKTPSQMVRDHDNKLAEIDAIHPYPWAMRKVEFEARRAANNEKFAASGFVHFGKHTPTGENTIKEGLSALPTVYNNLFMGRGDSAAQGASRTQYPVINIAGVVTKFSNTLSSTSIYNSNKVKLPPAEDGKRTYDSATGVSVTHATPAIAFASETETNKVVTDRVDMWGFESFLREINDADPFVYENGLIQSLATNINGVSTVTDNVRPDTYFAWYEGDDSSTGKGVNWKTATEAQRTTIASNPDNNIYFDDATGKFYQWCIRGRSFAGVGNGEWDNIDAISGDLQFDSFNKITPTMSGSTKFSAEGDIGVFTAENNSHCHLLVCGTVNRLNQGVYHPSFNPAGSVADINGNKWHDTALSFTSTASYFDPSKLSTTVSGRPDGRLANYIYASGAGGVCRDMRYSAWSLTQEDFAAADLKVKSGEYRGIETLPFTQFYPKVNGEIYYKVVANGIGIFKITDWDASPDVKTSAVGDYVGAMVVDNITYVVDDIYKNNSNELIIRSKSASGFVEIGDVVSLLLFTYKHGSKVKVSGEYTHTEVIGDPANILQCDDLKDGWVGSWQPQLVPDNTPATLQLTKPALNLLGGTFTSNNGASWASWGTVLDTVKNSVNAGGGATSSHNVYMLNYKTKASMTQNSVNSEVYGGEESVKNVSFYSDSLYSALQYSLIDKIPTQRNWLNILENIPLNGFNIFLNKLSISGSPATHSVINLAPPSNNSPAFKALNYNVEENQQGFINYAYTELTYDDAASDWGDDGKIHITDNQSTRLDDNGNSVVYGTARIVEPLGWIKNDK